MTKPSPYPPGPDGVGLITAYGSGAPRAATAASAVERPGRHRAISALPEDGEPDHNPARASLKGRSAAAICVQRMLALAIRSRRCGCSTVNLILFLAFRKWSGTEPTYAIQGFPGRRKIEVDEVVRPTPGKHTSSTSTLSPRSFSPKGELETFHAEQDVHIFRQQ